MATDIKLNSPKQIITNELIDNRIQIAYTHTHTNRKRRRRDKYTHQNYAHVWIWNLDIHIRFLYSRFTVIPYGLCMILSRLCAFECMRTPAPLTPPTTTMGMKRTSKIDFCCSFSFDIFYRCAQWYVTMEMIFDVCVCAALCVLFGNWPHWMRSKLINHKLPLAFFASYSISSLNFSFDSPLADCFDILCTTDNLYHTISYFEFERTLREK